MSLQSSATSYFDYRSKSKPILSKTLGPTENDGQISASNSNPNPNPNSNPNPTSINPLATSTSASTINTNRSRSRGQLQRKHSTTRSTSTGRQLSNVRHGSNQENPPLGGLFWTDFVVLGFTYVLNLIRTCGIAELFDVAFKGFLYLLTGLPIDFYQRWSLASVEEKATKEGRAKRLSPLENRTTSSSLSTKSNSRSASDPKTSLPFPSSYFPGSENWSIDPSSTTDQQEPSQLSPFHHLIILLTKFACTNFPHLLPRVLFAEENIGGFVNWRTGGGARSLVHELLGPEIPTEGEEADDEFPSGSKEEAQTGPRPRKTTPSFRAYWIGTDAKLSTETRSNSASAKYATTVLYLHGGGFSLGSVAFYAEALLRILGKISSIEKAYDPNNYDARFVAVEYDLAPTVRFPHPLLQCLRCYRHLIQVEKINPDNIVLAGDSAGGNLVMSMLLILSGQYDVEKSKSRASTFGGEFDWKSLPLPGKALLLSPWVDLRPSKAHSFAHLRDLDGSSKSPFAASSSSSKSIADQFKSSTSASKNWTDAVSAYEWDYVSAETLLHFAQLYAGVLETPRRVRGPLGWLANICGAVADGYHPTSDKALKFVESSGLGSGKRRKSKSKGRKNSKNSTTSTSTSTAGSPRSIVGSGNGSGVDSKESYGSAAARTLFHAPRALALLTAPPRKVARGIQDALCEPVFSGTSFGKDISKGVSSESQIQQQLSTSLDPAQPILGPLFPYSERKTDIVESRHQLYVPFKAADSQGGRYQDPWGNSSSSDTETESDASRAAKASRILDHHPLISPVLGDWSCEGIRLKGGMLVSWGERERMSLDIQTWIERAKAGKGSERDEEEEIRGRRNNRGKDSKPSQDGKNPIDQETEAKEDGKDHVDWIHPVVQHGPGGVHVWPFVSMYLAGTDSEREQGLDMIARFCASKGPAMTPQDSISTRSTPISTSKAGLHSPPQAAPDSPSSRFQISTSGYGDSQREGFEVSPADSHGSMPSDVGLEDERNYGFGYPRRSEFGYSSESASASQSPEQNLDFASRGLSPDGSLSPPSRQDQASEERRLGLGLDVFPGQQSEASIDSMLEDEKDSEGQEVENENQGNDIHSQGIDPDEPSQAPISSPDIAEETDSNETHQPVFLTRYDNHQSDSSPERAFSREDPPSPTRSFGSAKSSGSGSSSGSRTSGSQRNAWMDPQSSTSRGRSNVTSNPLWWQAQTEPNDVQRSDFNDMSEQLEDIEELSEGALSSGFSSPNRVASPPGWEASQNSYSGSFASAGLSMGNDAASSIPMDLSNQPRFQFGYRRPEPEGLSDITEEGSVLSASITSGGDRAFSPPPLNMQFNPRQSSRQQPRQPTYSEGPSVLRSVLQERDREWEERRAMALGNEQNVEIQDGDYEEEDDQEASDPDSDAADEEFIKGSSAFSPPAAPQPDPEIPLSRNRLARQSSEDLSLQVPLPPSSPSSINSNQPSKEQEQDSEDLVRPVPRKKPKGDVWW